MTTACTILIAPPDLIAPIKEQGGWTGEVIGFADTDPLRALEAILKRQPRTVALERGFAMSPRGAALINRLRADPTLAGSDIVVVSSDAKRSAPTTAGNRAAQQSAPAPQPVDWRGTRSAQRFRMRPDIEVSVDGNPAKIIDLSTAGTMVVLTTVLRPNQRVRVMIIDDDLVHRLVGVVAWSSFEMSSERVPQYRAGIAFKGADASWLADFCQRNQIS